MTKKLKAKKVSIAEYERRRKRWLEALESGKLLQTTSVLHRKSPKGNPSFCCLGVACSIFQPELKMPKVLNSTLFEYGEDADAYSLPEELARYLGFTAANTSGVLSRGVPVIKTYEDGTVSKYRAYSLVTLNDTCGYTFKEIAAVVKKYPHKLWAKGTYKPSKKKAK